MRWFSDASWRISSCLVLLLVGGLFALYHMGVGRHPGSQMERDFVEPISTNSISLIPATDMPTLALGRKIFDTHCLICHTETGAGLVGPNLTDAYWKHGPTFADTVRVVIEGVPGKGMISWTPLLKKDEIHAVCSYLLVLRGTEPENGKAPEGRHYPGSDSWD